MLLATELLPLYLAPHPTPRAFSCANMTQENNLWPHCWFRVPQSYSQVLGLSDLETNPQCSFPTADDITVTPAPIRVMDDLPLRHNGRQDSLLTPAACPPHEGRDWALWLSQCFQPGRHRSTTTTPAVSCPILPNLGPTTHTHNKSGFTNLPLFRKATNISIRDHKGYNRVQRNKID